MIKQNPNVTIGAQFTPSEINNIKASLVNCKLVKIKENQWYYETSDKNVAPIIEVTPNIGYQFAGFVTTRTNKQTKLSIADILTNNIHRTGELHIAPKLQMQPDFSKIDWINDEITCNAVFNKNIYTISSEIILLGDNNNDVVSIGGFTSEQLPTISMSGQSTLGVAEFYDFSGKKDGVEGGFDAITTENKLNFQNFFDKRKENGSIILPTRGPVGDLHVLGLFAQDKYAYGDTFTVTLNNPLGVEGNILKEYYFAGFQTLRYIDRKFENGNISENPKQGKENSWSWFGETFNEPTGAFIQLPKTYSTTVTLDKNWVPNRIEGDGSGSANSPFINLYGDDELLIRAIFKKKSAPKDPNIIGYSTPTEGGKMKATIDIDPKTVQA